MDNEQDALKDCAESGDKNEESTQDRTSSPPSSADDGVPTTEGVVEQPQQEPCSSKDLLSTLEKSASEETISSKPSTDQIKELLKKRNALKKSLAEMDSQRIDCEEGKDAVDKDPKQMTKCLVEYEKELYAYGLRNDLDEDQKTLLLGESTPMITISETGNQLLNQRLTEEVQRAAETRDVDSTGVVLTNQEVIDICSEVRMAQVKETGGSSIPAPGSANWDVFLSNVGSVISRTVRAVLAEQAEKAWDDYVSDDDGEGYSVVSADGLLAELEKQDELDKQIELDQQPSSSNPESTKEKKPSKFSPRKMKELLKKRRTLRATLRALENRETTDDDDVEEKAIKDEERIKKVLLEYTKSLIAHGGIFDFDHEDINECLEKGSVLNITVTDTGNQALNKRLTEELLRRSQLKDGKYRQISLDHAELCAVCNEVREAQLKDGGKSSIPAAGSPQWDKYLIDLASIITKAVRSAFAERTGGWDDFLPDEVIEALDGAPVTAPVLENMREIGHGCSVEEANVELAEAAIREREEAEKLKEEDDGLSIDGSDGEDEELEEEGEDAEMAVDTEQSAMTQNGTELSASSQQITETVGDGDLVTASTAVSLDSVATAVTSTEVENAPENATNGQPEADVIAAEKSLNVGDTVKDKSLTPEEQVQNPAENPTEKSSEPAAVKEVERPAESSRSGAVATQNMVGTDSTRNQYGPDAAEKRGEQNDMDHEEASNSEDSQASKSVISLSSNEDESVSEGENSDDDGQESGMSVQEVRLDATEKRTPTVAAALAKLAALTEKTDAPKRPLGAMADSLVSMCGSSHRDSSNPISTGGVDDQLDDVKNEEGQVTNGISACESSQKAGTADLNVSQSKSVKRPLTDGDQSDENEQKASKRQRMKPEEVQLDDDEEDDEIEVLFVKVEEYEEDAGAIDTSRNADVWKWLTAHEVHAEPVECVDLESDGEGEKREDTEQAGTSNLNGGNGGGDQAGVRVPSAAAQANSHFTGEEKEAGIPAKKLESGENQENELEQQTKATNEGEDSNSIVLLE